MPSSQVTPGGWTCAGQVRDLAQSPTISHHLPPSQTFHGMHSPSLLNDASALAVMEHLVHFIGDADKRCLEQVCDPIAISHHLPPSSRPPPI